MPVHAKVRRRPPPPDELTADIAGGPEARQEAQRIVDEYNRTKKLARELAAAEGFDIRAGAADLDRVVIKALPKKIVDRIIAALQWVDDDDLLSSLVKVKKDFTLSGFKVRCIPDGQLGVSEDGGGGDLSTGNLELEETVDPATGEEKGPQISPEELERFKQQAAHQVKLNKISILWKLYYLVDSLLHDWYCTDSMILYWKFDEEIATGIEEEKAAENSAPSTFTTKQELLPGLVDICALNPKDVDWDNSYGQDRMRLVIPDLIKTKVEEALRNLEARDESIKALMKQGIPKRWIESIEKSEPFVDLLRDEGDNWIVVTRNRAHHGLVSPSMYTIFLALEARRMLSQGDLSAAFMMKHFIFHAKAGESITQGPMAGQRNNWAKKKDIDAIFTNMKTTDKAMRIASNHTVTFEYIYPPPEMFAEEKYKKSDMRIYNWAGVNVVVMMGEGGTNSSGFLGVKRMVSSIIDARRRISETFTEFFSNELIRKSAQTPEGMSVVCNFDENILKEPQQLLDEVKFMIESGIGDPSIALAELGRDPEAVRLKKLQSIIEHKRTKVYAPIYVAQKAAGNRQISQSKPGRPNNPGTTKSEETRRQPETTK